MTSTIWGGSRGGSGGSVEPPKRKEKNILTRTVSKGKNISERNKIPV